MSNNPKVEVLDKNAARPRVASGKKKGPLLTQEFWAAVAKLKGAETRLRRLRDQILDNEKPGGDAKLAREGREKMRAWVDKIDEVFGVTEKVQDEGLVKK